MKFLKSQKAVHDDDEERLQEGLLAKEEFDEVFDDAYTSFRRQRDEDDEHDMNPRGLKEDDEALEEYADENYNWLSTLQGKQTFERYIVEQYLMHRRWYNPQKDDPAAPSLLKAWAFFEHFTLPRKFVPLHNIADVSALLLQEDQQDSQQEHRQDSQQDSQHDVNRYPGRNQHDKGKAAARQMVTTVTRAPPGETKSTELYHPLRTPESALSDFGIGVGMYFSTLSTMTVIFLLAGCLGVANILYYSSPAYDPDRSSGFHLMLPLQASAVCLAREWVVCLDCQDHISFWDNLFTNSFYGLGTIPHNNTIHTTYNNTFTNTFTKPGDKVTLISRTTCQGAQFEQGLWNLLTLVFLLLSTSLFVWYQRKVEIRMDEDKTSASDYTIVVQNPPKDALDPEEWKLFFEQLLILEDDHYHTIDNDDHIHHDHSHHDDHERQRWIQNQRKVTICTIALNNHDLLEKLIQRRQNLRLLWNQLPSTNTSAVKSRNIYDETVINDAITTYLQQQQDHDDDNHDDDSTSQSITSKISQFLTYIATTLYIIPPNPSQLWGSIQKQTLEIISLMKERQYEASAIYVTFESEKAQRLAMKALDTGKLDIWTNSTNTLSKHALFRGKQVLRVSEADEPDTVRWTDLDYTDVQKYLRRFRTLLVTTIMIGLSLLLLYYARTRVNTILFSILLTTMNVLMALIVRTMVSFEKHDDEGDMQASLYINIALFRWSNTVIIPEVTSPFLGTLGAEGIDLLNAVNALILSEMIYSPVLRYFDFVWMFSKHYLAPRAKNQQAMYECFNGSWYSLADRFTDFTKVLLLCVFYSALYPLIYFAGAAILVGQYWMDKFLLLRAWQKAPLVGAETPRYSRQYFTTAAMVIGAIASAVTYAQFPFTNVCDCNLEENHCPTSQVPNSYVDVTLLNGDILSVVNTSSTPVRFCNQHLFSFPAIPSKQGDFRWMTDSQERLTHVFGWFSLALFVVFAVGVFGHHVIDFLASFWKGVYSPRGMDQNKDFTDGIGVDSFGYIPQLQVPGFNFPFLVCDIDNVDVRLIGWQDPDQEKDDAIDPHRHFDHCNLIYDVVPEAMNDNKDHPIFSIVKQWLPDWAEKTNEIKV